MIGYAPFIGDKTFFFCFVFYFIFLSGLKDDRNFQTQMQNNSLKFGSLALDVDIGDKLELSMVQGNYKF